MNIDQIVNWPLSVAVIVLMLVWGGLRVPRVNQDIKERAEDYRRRAHREDENPKLIQHKPNEPVINPEIG